MKQQCNRKICPRQKLIVSNLACPVAESAIRPVGQQAITAALLEEDRHPGSHVRYSSSTLYDCDY